LGSGTGTVIFFLLVFDCSCQDHKSAIKAIYSGTGFLEGAVAGEEVGLVLDSTSFYAEQGGQVLCCSQDQLLAC